MAEGVLLNIVERVVANVASEPFKKIKVPLGFRDELRKLNNTLTTIRAVLLDAEQKKETNKPVKGWLNRLEDVVYDADNLLDEHRYQQLRRRVLFAKKKAKKVRIFFSRSNQLVFRLKMAKKIKQIGATLDEIKADQVFSTLVERDHEETRAASTRMGGRETHSFVISEEVIGRDSEKKKIIEFLSVESEENVSIMSIVGIGGLGKTTLTQFAFNDKSVKEHFGKEMWWACVSDVSDLKSLVQRIITSVKNAGPDQNLDLEQLQNDLRKVIEGKRYLLVPDDVWNDDRNIWDELRKFFGVGAKGSVVIVTTRSTQVAQVVHSTKIYNLGALDEERSWDLFKRVAFEDLKVPPAQNHPLVKIGEGIVEKCKGVPLAIKTVGRLLQSKKYTSQNLEMEWKNIRDAELVEVDIQDHKNGILPVLKLSYNKLPSHLKHCFAYCSLFPKHHRIKVPQLVRLWIAQRFIKPDGSRRQLEDIGYECFMNLFWGCFFQEARTGELSGAIESCKMHDLMHDLACSVAGKSVKILVRNILGELERNSNSTRLDGDRRNASEKV